MGSEIHAYHDNREESTNWQWKKYEAGWTGLKTVSFRVYYWIRFEQHIKTAEDKLEKDINDEINTVDLMLRTLMYIVSTNSIGS